MMGKYAFDCLTPYCEDQMARAFDFAHDIGFKGNNPEKLLTFLKNTPAEVIVEAMINFRIKIEEVNKTRHILFNFQKKKSHPF